MTISPLPNTKYVWHSVKKLEGIDLNKRIDRRDFE